MVIDFSKIKEEEHIEFRGGQGNVFMRPVDDEVHKIFKGRLTPGSSIGFHSHEKGSEVIYILEGEANVLDGDQEIILHSGMAHYCATKHFHSVRNFSKEDLHFFAVVTKY